MWTKDQATRKWERCLLFLAQQSIRRPHSIWWIPKACNSTQITLQLIRWYILIMYLCTYIIIVILIQQMDCWFTLSSWLLPCWHFLYLIVWVVTLISASGQQYCNSHCNRLLRLRKPAAPNSLNSIAQFYNNVLQDYNYILWLWFLHSYPPCFCNICFLMMYMHLERSYS